MWIGGTIYFNSDRNGTFNLYAYDVAKKTTTPRHVVDDMGRALAERGRPGGAHRLRVEWRAAAARHEDAARRRRSPSPCPTTAWRGGPAASRSARQIRDVELSPKGERALFAARGDIFTAPIEKGPTRNLTRSSGAHDKWPRWSPDGRRIAFMSDMSGEDELYVVAQDGTGKPEALTKGGQAFRYAPAWSPDGDAHRVRRQGRQASTW